MAHTQLIIYTNSGCSTSDQHLLNVFQILNTMKFEHIGQADHSVRMHIYFVYSINDNSSAICAEKHEKYNIMDVEFIRNISSICNILRYSVLQSTK